MRIQSLVWFYDRNDFLIHLLSLKFDPNTPNRMDNEFFGGTDLDFFEYELVRQRVKFMHPVPHLDMTGKETTKLIPLFDDQVRGAVTLGMRLNLHSTELWSHLTSGKPLSKIIVKHYQVDETGRWLPFVNFTFKECWLFDHRTLQHHDKPADYQIKFTYCCSEIFYAEGNRFAEHERCKPQLPSEYMQGQARLNESRAKYNAEQDQKALETSRLKITAPIPTYGAPVIHRFDVTAPSEFNGQQIGPGGLDDFAFHIVEEAQGVDTLIDKLYKDPTPEIRSHFRMINKHLLGGVALPAQLVMMTTKESMSYIEDKLGVVSDLANVEMIRRTMVDNMDEFSKNFTDVGNAAGMVATGVGFATTYFHTHLKEVEKLLKELAESYTKGFRTRGGNLKLAEMKALRVKKFKQLNSLLTKAMQNEMYGRMAGPKNAHKLKLNPRAIEHDWRIKRSNIVPTLSEYYKNVARFGRAVKAYSYIAIPILYYATDAKIKEACTEGEEQCKRAKYVEWSGFVGSVLGGGLAGYGAGATVSAVLLFTPIGGLVAVGLIAGSSMAAGYFAGNASKDKMKEFGEREYQKSKLVERDIIVETSDEIGAFMVVAE